MNTVNIWKFIFNPPVGGGVGHAENCVKLARLLGYKMFAWNGTVYAVPPEAFAWDCQELFKEKNLE